MKYFISNYYVFFGIKFPSELMDYEEAMKECEAIVKRARRGLCEFPELVAQDGTVMEV